MDADGPCVDPLVMARMMAALMADRVITATRAGQTYAVSIVFEPAATRDEIEAVILAAMSTGCVRSVAVTGPG